MVEPEAPSPAREEGDARPMPPSKAHFRSSPLVLGLLVALLGVLPVVAVLLPAGSTADAVAAWAPESTAKIKPGVQMPSFQSLPDRDVAALAAYLESLK